MITGPGRGCARPRRTGSRPTAERTLTPAVTLVGGFELPNGSYWGRPDDAAPGPDGALYVSDDTTGAIYRLTP